MARRGVSFFGIPYTVEVGGVAQEWTMEGTWVPPNPPRWGATPDDSDPGDPSEPDIEALTCRATGERLLWGDFMRRFELADSEYSVMQEIVDDRMFDRDGRDGDGRDDPPEDDDFYPIY